MTHIHFNESPKKYIIFINYTKFSFRMQRIVLIALSCKMLHYRILHMRKAHYIACIIPIVLIRQIRKLIIALIVMHVDINLFCIGINYIRILLFPDNSMWKIAQSDSRHAISAYLHLAPFPFLLFSSQQPANQLAR